MLSLDRLLGLEGAMAAGRRRSTEVELWVDTGAEPLGISDWRTPSAPPLKATKPASPKARVQWALSFLQKNLEDPRKRDGDYNPIRIAAAKKLGLNFKVSTADLREAQRTLRALRDQAVKDDVLEFNAGPMWLVVSLGRGRSAGVQIDQVPHGRYQQIVLGVLDAMQKMGPRLRLCGEKGCGKLFIVDHVRKFLCAPHAVARQAKREANWHRAQRKRDLAWEAYKRKHPNATRRPQILASRAAR